MRVERGGTERQRWVGIEGNILNTLRQWRVFELWMVKGRTVRKIIKGVYID